MKTSQNHILFVPFCRLLAFSFTKNGTISRARTSALLNQRLLAELQPLLAGPERTSHKCLTFSSCPRVWNDFSHPSNFGEIHLTIQNYFHHPKSISPSKIHSTSRFCKNRIIIPATNVPVGEMMSKKLNFVVCTKELIEIPDVCSWVKWNRANTSKICKEFPTNIYDNDAKWKVLKWWKMRKNEEKWKNKHKPIMCELHINW